MKFSEMKYTRPDIDKVREELAGYTEELKSANSYPAAKAVFLKEQDLERKVMTQIDLVFIRHSIDTRDEFYDAEQRYIDEASPLFQETMHAWIEAMLSSPFRPDFEKEYGGIFFVNAELQKRAFSPDLIPDMQKENELKTEYAKLIASAQIPFEDGTYTLSQLSPFKNDANDVRRLAAWKAEGNWYKEHQDDLDRIYDELVHLRDGMGKKLGYENYIPLGYDRMERNCYRKEEVERFRESVQKHVVPIADRIFREQAKRVGFSYPMSFAQAQLEFRSGNPKPCGDAEAILSHGQKFYDELSPQTSAFFRMMRERELMDVLSKEGKEGGGYCTGLPIYGVPFIFANFNGTQGDVEVVTHEAGHAFAFYLNADRVPLQTVWASMESSEVHSMSMEFFAWPWAEGFFGADTKKFLYSHLAGALTFIPYGTMVDHFQHRIYEAPDLSPKERHGIWKELLGIYMPWLKIDGEIPFYSEGEGWQRQSHIYEDPFYYIDYCLAQTVALEFWAMIRKDMKKAWEHYLAFAELGGSRTFTELLQTAKLESPFEEETLIRICKEAEAFLDAFDRTSLV